MIKYRLNEPYLEGNEEKYVIDVLNSSWLSSGGKHTKIFEEKFAEQVNMKFAVAVQSGTAAIHNAAMALGLGENDKVIVPNYTCAGSIAGIILTGAKPIIIDVEEDTLGLDYNLLEDCIKKERPKALMIVHVYGFPARDTLAIVKLCEKYGIDLIEDCSEALGSEIDNRPIGSFGKVAVFSVRSEKMIGVGEGGIVLTNDKDVFMKIFYWASRAAPFRAKEDPYWKTYEYTGVGMNYLMPHLLGAVGRAQIENFKEILERKIAIGEKYRELLSGINGIRLQQKIPQHKSCYWLNIVILDTLETDQVRALGQRLIEKGIEIRPGFWPLGDLEVFKEFKYGSQKNGYQVFEKGIVLPASVYLADCNCEKIEEIVNIFLEEYKKENSQN